MVKQAHDENVASRIESALDRIEAGEPRHELLVALKAAGKRFDSFKCASLEGSFSRTLIGHKKCAHPASRMRLLKIQKSNSAKGSSKARAERSAQTGIHQSRISELETLVASQALRILDLEEKLGGDDGSVSRFRRKDRRHKAAKGR